MSFAGTIHKDEVSAWYLENAKRGGVEANTELLRKDSTEPDLQLFVIVVAVLTSLYSDTADEDLALDIELMFLNYIQQNCGEPQTVVISVNGTH